MTPLLQNAWWMAKDRSVTAQDILESMKYKCLTDDIQATAVLFNRYDGPKNDLLYELIKTIKPENRETRPMAEWFVDEYRNSTIIRLAEQHAEEGFDFARLGDAIFAATGDENRRKHAMDSGEIAMERWKNIRKLADQFFPCEPVRLEA